MNTYIKKHIIARYTDGNYVTSSLNKVGLMSLERLKGSFDFNLNVSYKPYYPRKTQRYQLVAEEFLSYFKENILDVGTRSNTLSELTGKECQLVDKNNPDLPEFDWEKERLPYSKDSFDTVVCLDVLEHVDNLHEAFNDLLRVSDKYVIISLPNNWKKALNEFIKGRGRWPAYGIPLEKPKDRHKWFFNTEDAEDFIFYHADIKNYDVREVLYHVPKTIPRIKILYPILKVILPQHHFKNLFVGTIFFVLKKKKV